MTRLIEATHVCIDCGLWYQRRQHQGEARRCLRCAMEYSIDVIEAQARRTPGATLARKYKGRAIDTLHPTV